MVDALVYVIIGLLFFFNPTLSFTLVAVLTGIVLIINGVISICSYFKRSNIDLFNYNLIFGILLVIVGIVTLGIYLIIIGAQKLCYGLILRKFDESSWITVFIIGFLFFILGVVTIFTSPDAVVKVAGICLLGYGLINFVNTLLLRRRAQYFLS